MWKEDGKEIIRRFLNEDAFESIDRQMLDDALTITAAGFPEGTEGRHASEYRLTEKVAAIEREVMSTAVSLFSARVGQKQAESQDRHATWMKWLTVAITVATIAQVVVALLRLG